MNAERCVALALGVVWSAWCASPAHAEPAASESSPPAAALPNVSVEPVRIVVVGTVEQLERLRGVVAAWRLGDRPLQWERAENFDPHGLFSTGGTAPEVVCWVDLSRGSTVPLYFANGRTQRFLVRSLETSGRLDELDREALGQTVELSLLALLEDQAAGLSRKDTESLLALKPEAPIRAEPMPPARAVSRPPYLEVGAFYSVQSALDVWPVLDGPGLGAALVFPPEPRWSVTAAAHYHFAERWTDPLSELELQVVAFRLAAELAPRLYWWGRVQDDRALRLAIRLGGGADWVQVRPGRGERTPEAVTAAAHPRLDWIVTSGLGAVASLSSQLNLRLGCALEVAPDTISYEAEVEGRRQTVFRSLRFRPGLLAGLSWRFR